MGVYQREARARLSETGKRMNPWINRNKKGLLAPGCQYKLKMSTGNSPYPAIFNVRPCLQTIASRSEPRILFA